MAMTETDTRYNSGSQELEEIKTLLKRGDYDAARSLTDRVAKGFAESGNKSGQAWCELYHADIAFGLGAFELALEKSTECLGRFTKLGSKEGMGWTLRNLQRCYCMLKDWKRSMGYGQQALEIFDSLKDPKGAAVAMRWLGVCHQQTGELDTARAETMGAMRHFFFASDAARTLECIHDLSFIEVKAGRAADALRLQKYVVKHSQSPRWAVIDAYFSIGKLQDEGLGKPDINASLEVLVPSLLAGRIPETSSPNGVMT
jgi:tetratricopeptide (TPR) repeat protein